MLAQEILRAIPEARAKPARLFQAKEEKRRPFFLKSVS
jgi:hypothetical protein